MTPKQQLAADRARVAKLRIEAQNGTAEWCADLSRVCDLADIAIDLSEKSCRELASEGPPLFRRYWDDEDEDED
jgi:hypothetical protein